MRAAFTAAATALLARDPRTALVLADIGVDGFEAALRRHPDRAINVGIREQLMVSVAGGLALTGLRPIAHSYAPFLVERGWEQIKLDLAHQGVGAILVSIGASYDSTASGRTHFGPGDVALFDTLDATTVYVPGHRDEVAGLLDAAADGDDLVYLRLSEQHNRRAYGGDGALVPLQLGHRAVVVAVGPTLDATLAACEGLDVTVAYTHRPRPFDGAGLRGLLARARTDLAIVVEPYLAGTSAHAISAALSGVPHRLVSLGVGRTELHRYGDAANHTRAHGLDPAGLRRSITAAQSINAAASTAAAQ